MRVLLDNCVPWRLGRELSGHAAASVISLGWANLEDGPLLELIAGRFDVLLTMDKSIPFQHRLSERPFAVVVMRAKSNHIRDLIPIVPHVLAALDEIAAGQVIVVGTPHT